jgi:hypothetical protein
MTARALFMPWCSAPRTLSCTRLPSAVIQCIKKFPGASSSLSASGSTPRLSHTTVMAP